MINESIAKLLHDIEVKDLVTAAHTWRVALYARAMAEKFGCDPALVHRITLGAALHDLGKVDVPDAILQKPGPLSAEERLVMERHPVLGYDRLVALGEQDDVVLGLVRHHHERVDGTGYPDRLRGESIAPGARYFAVIDAFDAMTSVRPYRRAVGEGAVDRALQELAVGSGTKYWSDAVSAFSEMVRAGELDWIREHFADRCELPAFRGTADCQTFATKRRAG